MTLVAGVDSCPKGWVVIVLNTGTFHEAFVAQDVQDFFARLGSAAVIGVDMPIGLTDGGDRLADQLARGLLKGGSSSVFGIPPRPVLEAQSYDDANRLSRELCRKGITQQAYALRTKLLDLDAHCADARLHEVHPELSFRLLSSGERLPSKKSWNGQMRRRALLAGAGIELSNSLSGDAGHVAVDDLLDAAVAAWTAWRIRRGEALAIPAPPAEQRDRSGRLIQIWR